MKTSIAIILLFIGFATPAFPLDLKKEFQKNLSSLNVAVEAANLKKYKIIVLRGIFNNYVNNLNDFLYRLGAPFEEKKYATWTREIELLNKAGIDAEIGPFKTEERPEENGEILFKVISASKKPVIIISHSKGGIDTLYGLIAHPEIWPKVGGWISIQTPIYGTELADLFLENSITEIPLRLLLEGIMGGDWPAIETLTVANMSDFHKKNQEKVKRLIKEVPILSVATYFEVKSPLEDLLIPLSEKSAFAILNNSLSNIGGIPNDGFTSVSAACLKGTPCLVLDNVDHGSLVADLEPFYTFNKTTRTKYILSFLKMLGPKN